MRSYCAVYVDAGYLLASGATRVTGTSLRGGVMVDHQRLIEGLIEQAEEASGLPLLRVNWYDSGSGPGGVPDRVQEGIGLLPRVKLRLGRLSNSGEQKGVDLRIGLDLVTHARNRVMDLAYLVSGDDDLTEAVEEAQGHGVQVLLLAAPDANGHPHGVSRHLQREADGITVIRTSAIDDAVKQVTRPAPAPEPPAGDEAKLRVPTPAAVAKLHPRRPPSGVVTGPPVGTSLVYTSATGDGQNGSRTELTDLELQTLIDEVCNAVLDTWLTKSTPEDQERLRGQQPYIPSDMDRALLIDMSDRLQHYTIDEPTRFVLRDRFWRLVETKLGG